MSEAQEQARRDGRNEARLDNVEQQLDALWALCKETRDSVTNIESKMTRGEGIILGTRATVGVVFGTLGLLAGALGTWIAKHF